MMRASGGGPCATVFLLGPLVGLSGGDMHALRLVDDWEQASPGSITLVAPTTMGEHLPARSRHVLRALRSPLDGRLLPMPVYVLNVSLRALLALRRAPRSDVVIAASHFFHDVIPCAVLARLWGARTVAYVYHLVEEERRSSGLRSRVSLALERFSIMLLRRVGAFVLVDNHATAQALVARGFSETAIAMTANAYDSWEPLPPRAPASTPTLAFCGRLTEEKGVWDALELGRRLPGVRLALLGDGPLRDAVRDHITRMGLDNVEFRGFVSEAEKWRVFRQAHAFVAPSREEGWGIAVGEALTAGLPAVVYDLPAYAHFGPRVRRVETGDIDGFEAAVRDTLARPETQAQVPGLPQWSEVLERERGVIAAAATSCAPPRQG
jgi:glycosyltransferase involved in cell wall biosynthesis